jgi:hypothetical protein
MRHAQLELLWNRHLHKAYRTVNKVRLYNSNRTVHTLTQNSTNNPPLRLLYTTHTEPVACTCHTPTQGSPARPRLARTKLRTSVSSVADMIYHGYASRLGAPVKMAPRPMASAHGTGPWHRPMASARGIGPWHRPMATAAHRACLLPCLGIHQATETVSCYALGRSGDAPIDAGRSADAAPPPARRVDPLLRFRVVVVALLMLGLGLGCWG